MSEEQPPVVYVVDDDPDMRDSLCYLMRSVGLQVEVFSTGAEFQAFYRNDRAGCLLFDVRMPDISGLELYEQLVRDRVQLPVIFMTAYADVPMAVRALKSGAVEFVEKPFNRQVLLERVQQAIADDRQRRKQHDLWSHIGRRLLDLTSREREVLDLVLTGIPNKSIAMRLDITERTVELRRASLMKKLQAQSTVELIRLVTQYEIFSGSRMSTSDSDSSANTNPQGLPDSQKT